MKTLTLNGREILAVEVPEDSYDTRIINSTIQGYKTTGGIYWDRDLPSGQWQIVGRANELTEEQARELVEKYPCTKTCFKDYTMQVFGDDVCITAIESLLSWCKANGITNQILLIKNK